MIAKSPVTIYVAQLGALNRGEADNALCLANSLQSAYHFELLTERIDAPPNRYRARNQGWDLETWVPIHLGRIKFPRPLLVLTSLPYTDRDSQDDPDGFFCADFALHNETDLAIVSTHVWTSLPGERPLEPYILSSLAAFVFGYTTKHLPIHNGRPDCLFDYWETDEDVDRFFRSSGLCGDCEHYLESASRDLIITISQVAGFRRLLNRALGRRVAFIAMPYRKNLEPIHRTVREALESIGWIVARADETPRPRERTEAVLRSILCADIVFAEITEQNPNVCYEVGFAHASGTELILMSQSRTIPFDLRTQMVIPYRDSKPGLKRLQAELIKSAGIGRAHTARFP